MSYALTNLRGLIRLYARNAADPVMYNAQAIDYAAQLAADEWMRVTKAVRSLDNLTLTSGSDALPSFPTGWTPEQSLQVYLTLSGVVIRPGIAFVAYEELQEWRYRHGSTVPSRQPTMMAIPSSDGTNGLVNTLADAPYVIGLWWWKKFTDWTPGQAVITATLGTANQVASVSLLDGGYYDTNPAIAATGGTGSGATFNVTMSNGTNPGSITAISVNAGGTGYTGAITVTANGTSAANITFNLPDEHLRAIGELGAPAKLQQNEPENFVRAAALWKEFREKAARIKSNNAGGRGGNVSVRDQESALNYPTNPMYYYPQA